ncbi:MAG: hypothetical protein WDO24_01485 [Pseudomonadota bacterium]
MVVKNGSKSVIQRCLVHATSVIRNPEQRVRLIGIQTTAFYAGDAIAKRRRFESLTPDDPGEFGDLDRNHAGTAIHGVARIFCTG